MAKNYYKRNYVDVVEIITPNFYLDEDISASGMEIDPILQVINGHILAANNISSIIPSLTVSSLAAISPYFIKQNKLTTINTYDFQSSILDNLGVKIGNFESSAAFKTYLDDTLLPTINTGSPTSYTDAYLIDNLSWVYFLNTSGDTYDPSSDIGTLIAEKLFSNKEITITDGIELFTKYIWKNYSTLSAIDSTIIPDDFVQGTETYTSGDQGLNNITTLVKLIYNISYADNSDTKVGELFTDYIATGYLSKDTISKGAFFRFLRSIATAISDVNDHVEDIEAIYNIEKCPSYQLPLIANLIGWKLFGENDLNHRLQLRNAVSVYKRKGTKAGIQLAIDSVLPSNTFEVSSIVDTLYESYLPNLIQYALVTDSSSFDSLSTWTKELAVKTEVVHYSYSDITENIQHVVDKIILDLYLKFPENFIFDNKLFDPEASYSYRGKVLPIPPYDDEKFYVQCQLTKELLNYLHSRLTCFGVTESFATQVTNYIKNNTILSKDRLSIDGTFMFHTSSYQSPPNYDDVVASLSVKDINSMGLWNAKSSHFNVFLDTSSYNFSSLNLASDTGEAIVELARTVNDFSPAHSIPVVDLFTNITDTVTYLGYFCNRVDVASKEFVSYTYGSSAVDMSAGASTFLRASTDQFTDSLLNSSVAISSPRNAVRRRNLKNLLEHKSSYSRTGFNQPVAVEPSATAYNGITLGFIPSSLSFADTSIINLKGVYNICNKLTSDNSFFGVDVSNCSPLRGVADIEVSSCLQYVIHGDTDEYIALIHKLYWDKLVQQGEYIVEHNYEPFFASSVWEKHSHNQAAILASTLVSVEDFELGSPIHRLYNDYTDKFGKHSLTSFYKNYLDGGKDIFSHTFGKLFFNGNLETLGIETSYQTTSLRDIKEISANEGSGLLSETGSNTYVASSTSSVYVDNFELRNAHVVSGIELVTTSATSNNNVFEYIALPKDLTKSHIYSTNFITSKAINGFPRIRFDLSTYVDNLLTPEHNFSIDIKSTILNTENKLIGGATIGVWIHTREVNGYIWTFTPDNEWVMLSTDSLTKESVLSKSHKKIIEIAPAISLDNCLGSIDSFTSKKLTILNKDNFNTFSINFNTKNSPISVPEVYYSKEEQVHIDSQNYFVEVFMLPSTNNTDKLFVLEEMKVTDTTNKSRASIKNDFTIDSSGINSSGIVVVNGTLPIQDTIELEMEELKIIFNYFNSIAIDNASRVIADTSALMLGSGGSRINYRIHPDWISTASKSANSQYVSLDITD